MFSVVPGVHDSDVTSSSESEKSDEEETCETQSKLTQQVEQPGLDEDSTKTCKDTSAQSEDESCVAPSGVSDQNWEKFQSLQKCRSETRWMRDVTIGADYMKKRRRKRRKQKDNRCGSKDVQTGPTKVARLHETAVTGAQTSASTADGSTTCKQKEHWSALKQYLNVNDHMKGIDQGKYAPKSGMEKKLDEAVAEGDFDKAEEISDGLAKRELGCKIAKAANARDYMAWKQEQEERREANRKKRRKLAWGFEAKERWQMKGNM